MLVSIFIFHTKYYYRWYCCFPEHQATSRSFRCPVLCLELLKNIYNFCIRYLNNTLPTLKNMVLWNKNQSSLCNACQNIQTLQHVVSACKVHPEEGRCTWRHNSILKAIGDYQASARKDINLFCDIDEYKSPSIITGDQFKAGYGNL